jgi:protocatechuate 3,4-dioxygenase beta subunit
MSHIIRGTLIGTATCMVALTLAYAPVAATGAETAEEPADPVEIALGYLEANPGALGVTAADVDDLAVASSYRSSHNGVTHVNVNQRFDGLEVFGAYATVNVTDEGEVLFVGDSLVSGLRAAGPAEPDLDALEAVGAAADDLDLDEPRNVRVIRSSRGVAQETVLSGGNVSDAEIPARLGWQPADDGLRLAWQLVIDDSSDVHLWNATVDAATGVLLAAEDWTSEDSPAGLASALARPQSAGAATSGVAMSSPDPVDDGSSYRVFALPKESPNDGPRTLVTNPADATASPFGWHDTNGAEGPEFTITRGNNVHAYLDQDNNNSPDFGDTDGGPDLSFDFPADLTEHAQNYRDAAVTNLYYWNNLIHDVLYQYGFDEQSGNFQADNYERGGTAGDYVRAEAADGAGVNNANFSTPVETATSGGTPRMQMFLWPGNQFGAQNQLVVDGVGTFDAGWSRFGAAPGVTGTFGEFLDAGSGCTAADYADNPGGTWVAIVTGGNAGCQNIEKARQAGAAGASAVVMAAGSSLAILTGSQTTAVPDIAVASVTAADGTAIRNAIAAGPVTGTVRKHPDHPGIRDGDFESGIVIHEYGHGVSNRLTGGPSVNCLSGNEQAGEGWSDFFAITMLLDPAVDDPDVPRGMGPYALFQDSRQGAGIRPRPYTRDMSIQPFTYDSIKSGGWLDGTSLALPHGLGHGWAAVLWDVTWDLIDRHGFNPDVYAPWHTGGNNRALQYVIDGLKFQGCGPGLVAARDAIIAAADHLSDGEDTCTLWASFARRGLGYSAVQGTTNRNDNDEAFDTHPDCLEGFFGGVNDSPAVNVVKAGSNLPLVFSTGGDGGLDILVENSPYSRQVNCSTLRTEDPDSEFITPRPLPIPTVTTGNAGLSYDPDEDRYTYPWKTLGDWAGTCREVVVTRTDGVQHRAFFRFDVSPSHPVSGHVLDQNGRPVPNVTVTLEGAPVAPATTDADGFYSFSSVPSGTYDASATATGECYEAQTHELTVSRPTTFDFTLPQPPDGFGYVCGVESAVFEEAGTVLPITGSNQARTIDLPFPFTFYGFAHTKAHVCSNGYIEFVGPASTTCASGNAAIPTVSRPNGAVFGFWDFLSVDDAASIRAEVKGDAPNRRFVIEYRNVHFSGDTSRRIDFNIVLHEDGQIVTQHRNIANDARERGSSATFGIENHTGTIARRYSFNQAVLLAEPAVTSIRYVPPPPGPAFPVTGHVRDSANQPVANATVRIEGTPITPATTDADGSYTFPSVPEGTYDATALGGVCNGAQTKQLVVSGPTTLDFELPPLTEILLIPDSSNDRVMAFDATTGDLIDADYIPHDPAANLGTPQHIIPNLEGDGYLLSDQIRNVINAYGLDGTWQGVFAPAGGADTSILQNMRGIAVSPEGTVLATVASGGNAHAIAEFDASGNYIGNFIDNGAGGMQGPWYILFRDSDVLVSSVTSSAIHRFTLDGEPLGQFHGPIAFPQQMQELENGNILVSNFSSPSGVWELDADGNLIDIYSGVTSNRGVYELPNGNILTTNSSGVHEVDRADGLVDTKISGVSSHQITRVDLQHCDAPALP